MIYAVVPGTQPLEVVDFSGGYPGESDAGAPGRPPGYPIPVGARTEPSWIEGGQPGGGSSGDRHMLLVDRDRRILFELYATRWDAGAARWKAGSGAVFLLDGNGRRPEGWTSADAAGLAILPGLVRYDEVFGPDPIRHAFRVTVRYTKGYVFPASHDASTSTSPNALPMGARLRLKAAKDISGSPAAGPEDLPGHEDLRPDRGRQRQQHVRLGGLRHALGQRRPEPGLREPQRVRLRGRRARAGSRRSLSTGPTDFYTLTPCRLLDTRLAGGTLRGAGRPRRPASACVVAAGRCGIPASAKARLAERDRRDAAGAGEPALLPGRRDAPQRLDPELRRRARPARTTPS